MRLPGDFTLMAWSLLTIAVCSVLALLKSFGFLRRRKGE
jgi:hypothetical protein